MTLGITGSIVLIICLVLLTAVFAMAEMALVSVRKTRIRQLAEEDTPGAKTVQRLVEDPTRFLATVQIGVTLVGLMASAVGAVELSKPLAALLKFEHIPNSSGIAVVIVTLIIGYVMLVLGEISPKSLGLQHAEWISLHLAKSVLVLSFIVSPAVKLITWSSNSLMSLFGGTASFSPPILTEEELKMLVEAGEEEGVLEEEEKEMIHSIFEFTDTVVRKVMVPRIDIKAVEVGASVEELVDVIVQAGHSRVPVFDETIDNIVGIVHAKDLLRAEHENGRSVTIPDLMRPPYVIPENKMVDELLTEFKKNKIQMAIVVDEYGGTAGLVTIEDLLEEIVGDIMDEYDVEGPMEEVIDENSRIVDSRTPIGEINEEMGLELPEEEFDTIGGLVFGLLGKQASPGDRAEYDSTELIVEKTQGRRISKVRVTRLINADEGESSTDD